MSILTAQFPFLWPSKTYDPESQLRVLNHGVLKSTSGRSAKFGLLSRARYRLKVFELGAVPARERRAVLRNLLLAWSPFDRSDFRVVISGDRALGFAWDAQLISDSFSEANVKELPCVPEGLLRPAMAEDGARWVSCLEGVELQVWSRGLISASRWWAQRPRQEELMNFMRSVGGATSAVPSESELSWAGRPWAEAISMEALASNRSRAEQLATGVALMGLMALSAAQFKSSLAAYDEHRSLVAELALAEKSAAPVLKARELAMSQANEVASLSKQMTSPQPLELMQHLSSLLPAKGVVLKELELNGLKLRLGLELAPTIARSSIVKDLQAGGWLTGVSEARDAIGRSWVTFDMTLSGALPPVASPAPARAASGGRPS